MIKTIRNLYFLVNLLTIGCTVSNDKPIKTENLSTAKFQFDNRTFDFGLVKEGDTVQHLFSFTNIGKVPLQIKDVSTSCGCTVPSWPTHPIPIDGKGFIKVLFTKKGDLGKHRREIVIKANTDPEYSTIYIKAEIRK